MNATENDIIQFVKEVLTPNNEENTQEFYKSIIDALVRCIYCYDDTTIIWFFFDGGTNIKLPTQEEMNEVIKDIIGRNKSKLDKKFSIELEKWANIALNILNDAISIKPNTVVGDDNEPIFTAPSGVADIECYYNNFNAICEVTMLTSRDQWFNEGQPVMRHLRDFETKNKNAYCLFIAPSIHADTINTFWTATKYEYQGQKQNIVPITISQLIDLIDTVKVVEQKGKKFTSAMLEQFYKSATSINTVANSIIWQDTIKKALLEWKQACIA